jgi:hypothetical protein
VTEEEAKKKWCPQIQVATSQVFCRDNRGNGCESYVCIASECMWWVWDYTVARKQDFHDGEVTYGKPKKNGHCGAIK